MKLKIEREKDPDDLDFDCAVLILEDADASVIKRAFNLAIGVYPKGCPREFMTEGCDADIEEGWAWSTFPYGSIEVNDRTIKARCTAKDEDQSTDWISLLPIAKLILKSE